jgi:hypothetical protein
VHAGEAFDGGELLLLVEETIEERTAIRVPECETGTV